MSLGKPGPERSRLATAEYAVGILLTLALIVLYATTSLHAGPLWRDEVNTLNVARLPTLASIYDHNDKDSFPILYHLVLRGWTLTGMGDSDGGLRVLGALTECSLLGVLWWAARQFRSAVPLVSLLLVGASPTLFRISNGVRAYSLAVLLMLATLVAFWRFVRDPTRARMFVAALFALLSVHAHFANAALLAAIVLASSLLAACRGRRDLVWMQLGIGVACALSMLPYLRTFRRHAEWSYLDRLPEALPLSSLVGKYVEALDKLLYDGSMSVPWFLLWIVTVGACAHMALDRSKASTESRELGIFLLATLLAGGAAFFGYLKVLKMPTPMWYYAPLIGLSGVVLDAGVSIVASLWKPARFARIALVLLLAGILLPKAWPAARTRWSNVSLVATRLEQEAQDGDYILVNPWYFGMTFAHYYSGPGEWSTLPALPDYRFEDHRPIIAKMEAVDPIGDILARIDATLHSGGRVWLVGEFPPVRPWEQVTPLAPSADGGRTGPNDSAYMAVWIRLVLCHLLQFAGKIEVRAVTEGDPSPLSRYEEAELYVANGWHE